MPSALFDRLWDEARARDYVVVQVTNWLYANTPEPSPLAVAQSAREVSVGLPIGCLNAVLEVAQNNMEPGRTSAVETFNVARGLHEAEHGFMESCGFSDRRPLEGRRVVGVMLIVEG